MYNYLESGYGHSNENKISSLPSFTISPHLGVCDIPLGITVLTRHWVLLLMHTILKVNVVSNYR